MQHAHAKEAGEVDGATPTRRFAEPRRGDAADGDTPPYFTPRVTLAWIVVRAPAADDRDLVAAFDKRGG
jgi:hypothetical protein